MCLSHMEDDREVVPARQLELVFKELLLLFLCFPALVEVETDFPDSCEFPGLTELFQVVEILVSVVL